jgi:hypothetical protein
MVLTHASPATTSEVLAVGALVTDGWSLTIQDNSATTPGRMDRVDCTTKAATGGSLATALAWASGSRGGDLGSSSAVVAQGTGPGTVTVRYTQPLVSSDAVGAGQCYAVTLTLTLS